jgi:hypothetical protein
VVGSEVASAGQEIYSISKGVTLFSLMLKQVGQTLQAPDSIHSNEAEQAARQITNECQQIFDEIEYMLDKVRTKRHDGSYMPTTIQKFRWCFKKHKVTYLLAQLESLKLSLSVMLQILQLGKLMAAPNKKYVFRSAEKSFANDKIVISRRQWLSEPKPFSRSGSKLRTLSSCDIGRWVASILYTMQQNVRIKKIDELKSRAKSTA